MESLFDHSPCSQPHTRPSTLLVMLPGAYDKPEYFVANGFVKALRDRKLDVDIQLVNAHPGYYTEFTVLDRLKQDVIAPAQAQGYSRIWLIGISLGGYGSLNYALRHSEDVAGMFVMAPFLGSRDIPASIKSSGGLTSWNPDQRPADEFDLRLWRWLQGYARHEKRPPLYIGFGDKDRFAGSNTLIAEVLPGAQVFKAAGGHDWATWKRLWEGFLDAGVLLQSARACAT